MSVLLTDIWALACDFVYVYRLVCSWPLQVHFTHWLRLALVLCNRGVPGSEPEIRYILLCFSWFYSVPWSKFRICTLRSWTHPCSCFRFVIL